MRAISYRQTGDPDVLTLEDRPVPEPGPGEVRVRVHRSGVNPTDWKSRRGSGGGAAVDPPQVPHHDGAGVVEALGAPAAGVPAPQVGTRVWLWEAAHRSPERPAADGTAQELTVVPAQQAVPLPEHASMDLGAALGIPFLTAHRCLTVAEGGPTRLGPGALAGRSVLVSGGAGAVGNAAVQLARWAGATVVTTVSSPEKARFATAAGADVVVDYTRQDVSSEVLRVAPDGVDAIVEVAAAANADLDVQVLHRHGCVAVYADDGGAPLSVPIRPLMVPNARLQFVLVYTAPETWRDGAIADVAAAVDDGAIRVGEDAGLPLHHYPLEQAAEAHAAVERHVVGKVLLDITD